MFPSQLTVSDSTSLLLGALEVQEVLSTVKAPPESVFVGQYTLSSSSIMVLEDAPGILLWSVPTGGSSGLLP